MSCLTEHDKNEYLSGFAWNLDCGIPYAFYIYLVLSAVVYDDDHINYVVTVLKSKLHIEE